MQSVSLHICVVTGQKPFACRLCPAIFTWSLYTRCDVLYCTHCDVLYTSRCVIYIWMCCSRSEAVCVSSMSGHLHLVSRPQVTPGHSRRREMFCFSTMRGALRPLQQPALSPSLSHTRQRASLCVYSVQRRLPDARTSQETRLNTRGG